jgi:hypothetical protein
MSKKKKPHGHPARREVAPNQLSPLKAGGRILGEQQIPFRRFLETEFADEPEVLPLEDLEARLMESLGWLALSFGYDLVPATGRRFAGADLAELFTEIVPQVAEDNDLDPQELVDETRLAWTSYLMFLGESETWVGEPEELADCLDVASGGVGAQAEMTGTVLDSLAAAEARVDLPERLADLLALPTVAAAVEAVEELGAEAADRFTPVPEFDAALFLTALGESDLFSPGELSRDEHRYQVATAYLAALVTDVLAACPSPGAIVGALSVVASSVLDPMASPRLRELLEQSEEGSEYDAALATVTRLTELGVLSSVEPWTARPGFAGAVLDVVEGFFAPDEHDGHDDHDHPAD